MTKICLYCGNEFLQKHLGRPKKFCRPACRSLHWKRNNREKANAHSYVYRILKGKKPSVCEVCGKRPVAHGHHENYKKRDIVVWVCTKCHYQLNRKIA